MALGNIPNDIRVPLVYLDIDNSQAVSGTPALAQKILVIGGQLAGTATPLTLTRITNDGQIGELYGQGAMLGGMLHSLRKANSYTETYALGVADLPDGAAATAEVVFTGTATAAGTVSLLIAGQSVPLGVSVGDTAEQLVAKAVASIAARTKLPVTAAAKVSELTTLVLTSKHKGLTGNDLDVRLNYYEGEQLPTGIAATASAFAGGTGTPDMTTVMAAIPDEWFNHIVMPYNDTLSLNTLRDELIARWGPLQMMEGIAYAAKRGTHAETGTWGQGRNDHLITALSTNLAPNPSWEWAASYAGVAAYHLGIDPARPLQTLVLPGLLPPSKTVRWDMVERNLLLHDGVATHYVTAGGEVAIEREISTYQVNAFGDPDPSYLDITTPATLGYLRYSVRTMVTQRFPRHKLADDNVLSQLDPAQPVVTPKIMRQALLERATEWVTAGLIEDFDLFAETLNVYRDAADRNRLNCVMHPDVVNQLRIFAGLIQFKL